MKSICQLNSSESKLSKALDSLSMSFQSVSINFDQHFLPRDPYLEKHIYASDNVEHESFLSLSLGWLRSRQFEKISWAHAK